MFSTTASGSFTSHVCNASLIATSIVEKNAIMQIGFALGAEINQGLTPMKAIYGGERRPSRWATAPRRSPTTAGSGGDGRIAVLLSRMTLYLTPVFYTYMAALQAKPAPSIRRKSLNDRLLTCAARYVVAVAERPYRAATVRERSFSPLKEHLTM